MKAFAAFILRGPLQAGGVVLAASLLPLLSIIGTAALALVTLRQGLQQGALVAAMAGAALYALMLGAMGTGEPALRLMAEQWLPALLLAEWLRRSVSLPQTLMVWTALGAVAVAGFYLVVPEPAAYWEGVIRDFLAMAGGEAELGPEAREVLERDILPFMTGLWAVNHMFVVLGGLLIARSLQALLYNPGGLRAELHGLDLGREVALGALALWVGGLLTGPGVVADLAMVTGAAFLVQGITLAHVLVASRGASGAWLVPAYVLAPLLFRPLALVGIGDALFQWRRRLAAGGS